MNATIFETRSDRFTVRDAVGILALVLTMAAVAAFVNPQAGVSCAFLGFIGKAIKAVVGTVGKVVGIGGAGNKPIQVTTGTDPNLAKLAESNAALAASITAGQQKKWYTNPVIIVGSILAGGLVIYLLVRKR